MPLPLRCYSPARATLGNRYAGATEVEFRPETMEF